MKAATENAAARDVVKLRFSDGRPDVEGIERANEILFVIGVRISTVAIPEEAKPFLAKARERATTPEEQAQLVALFGLHRGQLLDQVRLAGRQPQRPRGGYLAIVPVGAAPYPKVWDVRAMSPEMKKHALTQFSRLHINVAEDGVGVDEVMTIVAGGPFTYFYALPDGVTARLEIPGVTLDGPAVRMSYSGLNLHGALMDPPYGLIVAFAHGPKAFDQVFDDPSVSHPALMNTNPWIDYTQDPPRLKDQAG